ncbi:MAG: TIGR03089 family protein [Nitriliruptoraceae bacterium]
MRLEPPPTTRSRPDEVATALRDAAERLGHRPAVTVLLPDGRQEQSVASLAQWAAKGAHLLELDLQLEPGDRLHLDVPPSWPAVAVVLACWWAGIAVTLDGDAEVAVVHADRDGPAGAEVLRVGDGFDGAPPDTGHDEAWVRAVQAFPDQPPTPRAASGLAAMVSDGAVLTQAELLAILDERPGADAGPLGIVAPRDGGVDATTLVDLALRPLVSGRPTVVVRGVGREAADGERVGVWS